MNSCTLGNSGVEVSALGLGTYWTEDKDPDAAEAVIKAAYDAGIDWVDTGEAYYEGGNESNIAPALRTLGDVKVASKVAPPPEGSGLKATQVRQACEASLRRLGRDVIDVYFVHWPDDGVPLEETWSAMAELVTAGLVRAIGLSQYDLPDVRRAHAIRPVDVAQDGLSLVDYLHNRQHFAECAALGIAGVVYEPLASGVLSGTMTPDTDLSEWSEYGFWERLYSPGRFERSLAFSQRLSQLASQWGYTAAEIAVAWCTHQAGVSSVLFGTSKPDRARTNAAAADIRLTDAQMRDLDSLIPLGPSF